MRTLSEYNPTSRGVVFRKIRPEKLKSGLFIPGADFEVKTYSDMFDNEAVHKVGDTMTEYHVVKVGIHCNEIKPGDVILLTEGIQPQVLETEDETVFQVMEMQITGYFRKQE